MIKKILSFLLMISVVLSLFTIKANAKEMPVSINEVYCYYKDGKVTAEVKFNQIKETGVVYLAIYDKGKFVALGQEEFSKDKLSKNIKIDGADDSFIGYDAKIICLGKDNLLTPISAHLDVKITNYASVMVRKLTAVSNEIASFTDRSKPDLYTVFNNTEKTMLRKIKTCIDDAITSHPEDLTGDFIQSYYETQIAEVRGIYDKMTKSAKEAFKGKMVSNFTMANLVWVADALGIDLSSYGINKDDYI